MRRHGKASAAGSTNGSGRAKSFFAVLVLAACALGLAAAPAGAVTVTIPKVSDVSYDSAHVTGTVDPQGFATWAFQVSTDGTTWTDNLTGFAFSSETEVSGDLTGLKGGTKYFVRLVGRIFEGPEAISSEPNPEFTTLPVEPPSVASIDNASDVRWSLAKASGEVHRPSNADPAFDANCAFQYVTDAAFTSSGFENASSAPCEPNPVTTAGDSAVTASLSGLAPNTTYHLRLRVENAGGSDAEEAPSTFTTKAADPPTVIETDNASEVAYTTAKATGKVERPAGEDLALDANCHFEYVTDAQFTATGFENAGQAGCEPENPVTAAGESSVSANLTGLTVGTTYHLRLSASDAGGSDSEEAAGTFTTLSPTAPSVVETDDASAISYTAATASGKVLRPAGSDPSFDTSCSFEYVSDAQFQATGFTGANQAVCEGENPIAAAGEHEVEARLNGLTQHTTYHLRLSVSNAGGSDSEEAADTFTTLTVTPPSVSIDPVTEIGGDRAHFSGTLNANGTDPAFSGFWSFICTPACHPVEGHFEPDEQEHEIGGLASELEPNTVYEVLLRATNKGGTSETAPVSFHTAKVAPTVQTLFANNIGTNSATLAAKVNPRNSAVTYQFEWGLTKAYGEDAPIPAAPLGAVDNALHTVAEPIDGLEEGKTYHFRLTATNTETNEVAHGEDHTFTTEAVSPSVCANQQRRAENNSLALPECRAYELVSALQKGPGDAGAPHGTPQYSLATDDGEGIVYTTFGAQGTVTRGLQQYTVSRRQAGSWTAAAALPKSEADRINALNDQQYGLLSSSDLTTYAWGAGASWGGENPVKSNSESAALYRGTTGGVAEWLSQPQIPNPELAPGTFPGVQYFQTEGASPDLSTVYFWGGATILPEDSVRAGEAEQKWAMYEWSGGQTKPAGTLPDGSQPSGGSAPANGIGIAAERTVYNFNYSEGMRGQVSRDGSTMYFVSPDPVTTTPTQLYLRHNGHSTLVSHDAGGNPAPSGVVPVPNYLPAPTPTKGQYMYGAADGSKAIFWSEDALASGAPADSSKKAYLYDVEDASVTYLPGIGGATVLAASDDLSRFLFGGGADAGVWNEGTIEPLPFAGSPARSTPSGSTFIFTAPPAGSTAPMAGFNTGGHQQIFRYDVGQQQLSCLSCPEEELTATGDASFANGIEGGRIPDHAMSADGERVFFDSPAPLVPGDENGFYDEEGHFHGVQDVYEWTPGGLSLISSGRSPENSYFLDNSADGRDVFFATTEALDPRDTDGLDDVYDARIGGGFAQAAVTNPCSGNDGCKGATPAPPGDRSPGSASFSANEPAPTGTVGVAGKKLVHGKLQLRIAVPGAGTVTVSGKGLATTHHRYAKAGTYQLTVPLKGSAKRALHKKHRLKLKVRLRFLPTSGEPTTANINLTVKG